MTVETRLQELKRFEEQAKSELEANRKAMIELRQAVEESNRQNQERDEMLMQIQHALGRLLKEKGLPDDAPAAFQVQPKTEESARSASTANQSNTGSPMVMTPNPDYSVFLNPVIAKTTLTSQTRSGRIEFPAFDGSTSVRSWIFQAEQFFALNQSSPGTMSQIASLHLRGEALQWFEFYMLGKEEWAGWKEFYSETCLRFDLAYNERPLIELKNVVQSGSVVEMQESFAVDLFVGGLKEEIRHVVNIMNPTSLGQAFRVARIQEDNFGVIMKRTKNSSSGFKASFTNPGASGPSNVSPSVQWKKNNSPIVRKTWKSLTNREIEEKRAKGLCYYCDERYGPGHRCNKKLYRLDLCIEECGEEEEEEEEVVGEEVIEDLPQKCKLHHLQLQEEVSSDIKLKAITGETLYDTINVTGDVGGGQKILMLVDSGSTHNFLDEQVANQIGCELESTREFQVSLADGKLIGGNKKCRCLTWRMEGEYFQDEFLVLHVRDYDAILGVQWLQPLKQVTWDFEAKTLNFSYNQRRLTVPATPTPPIQWVREETTRRAIHKMKIESKE